MLPSENIRKHENLHIVFWLIKDSCWMLQLRWLGILMIIPTISIALLIVFVTRKSVDLYINLSILFWICANSIWMYVEFFTDGEYKLAAAFPFALGFIFVGLFYYKTLTTKRVSS
jgi:hypothetical protein